jgi:hypothetical protein
VLACAALLGALSAPCASGASAPSPSGGIGKATEHAIQRSLALWATINVCNPPDQPDAVGVRGSMPGDGNAHDKMYMSFRLQYLESAGQRWIDLAAGALPQYVAVGSAKSARQGGRSFQLVPVPGKPPFDLRGVVSFQWRRGSTVELSLSRPTTAGKMSLAGADPAGFSAANCAIG